MGTTATIFGVAACAAVALSAVPAWQRLRRRMRVRQRMNRLEVFVDLGDAEETLAAPPATDKTESEQPLVVLLDKIYPLAGGVRTGLAVLASAAIAGSTGVAALGFFGLPLLLALAAGPALAILVGWNVGAFLEDRLRVRYADRLLAAVDEFQRMVRFGMPTAEAFRSMTTSAEEPIRASLRRVRDSASLGVPLAAALDHEAQRVRISELAMLAAIFATQARVGGGLAESVGNLADMLRERKDNRARLRAATAESKLSLVVLSVVPFAAVAIQGTAKPEIFDMLLGDARHLLGIGAGLIILGLVSAWFLVRRTQQ